jgi:hypothetical protein
LAIASFTVALGFALAAFAQPKGARPAKHGAGGKTKPAASVDAGSSENPHDDKSTPAAAAASPSSAPASASAASDAGPVAPPPAAELWDGGTRPSPLNPAANEFSDGAAPPTPVDYDKLLADIASLRGRIAAVSDNLFHSRLAVALETNGDHGRIARLTVSLDDGVVFAAPTSFHADDMKTVWEHAVAPGRHAVVLDVERRDDRDESFRTSQKNRFIVDVPRDQKLMLEVKIWDDSNMGGDFPSDKKGRYELRVRAKAAAAPLGR